MEMLNLSMSASGIHFIRTLHTYTQGNKIMKELVLNSTF